MARKGEPLTYPAGVASVKAMSGDSVNPFYAPVFAVTGIDAVAKHILLILRAHAEADNGLGCSPSMSELSAESQRSERAVRRAVRRLEGAGIVETSHSPGRGQRRRYRFTFDQ